MTAYSTRTTMRMRIYTAPGNPRHLGTPRDGFEGTLPASASGILKMAANVDSPKRKSVRLHRGNDEGVTAEPRGLEAPPSGHRTLLSGNRPRRGSKGRTAEADGAMCDSAEGPGGAQHPTGGRTARSPGDKSINTTSQEDGRPEVKKERGLTPNAVNQKRSDVGEAGSSQKNKEMGQENVGRIKDLVNEVRASPNTSRTKDGEKACMSEERTRIDVEEAGPSGMYRVANSDDSRPATQSALRDSEKSNPSVLSPSRRPICGTKSPMRNADPGSSDVASGSAPLRDSKVQCTSKQLLEEVLGMCAEFSKDILESQSYINQEQRQLEHRNFIWNFETAFQDNVRINGQSWHEAPDTASEPDFKILEDQLDDAIVETAMKRKRHPRKILSHFVKGLKVEREILGLYKPVVEPKELKLDSRSESRMTEQTAATTAISQQIKETMKALPAQLKKAEGFSQVLNLQPVLQLSRIRQDIFSSQVVIQEAAKTKELETTPGETEPAANIVQTRTMRRWQSPSNHNNFYPLRSKRKISL